MTAFVPGPPYTKEFFFCIRKVGTYVGVFWRGKRKLGTVVTLCCCTGFCFVWVGSSQLRSVGQSVSQLVCTNERTNETETETKRRGTGKRERERVGVADAQL